MIVTGIGSRKTPAFVCGEMIKIGVWCKQCRIYVRSGHADGADISFESGSQEYCIAYIPWVGFNKELKSNAKLVVPEFTKELIDLMVRFHPAPDNLSFGAKKLMARNGCQVLGEGLKEPSSVVICWTEEGKCIGGSGQAIRIAEHYKIPVWNMALKEYDTANKVIDKLVEMVNK